MDNLAAASVLMEGFGAVNRVVFATTRWAWTRRSLADWTRGWFVNGLRAGS